METIGSGTLMVIVCAVEFSAVPSLTLKVKFPTLAPSSPRGGEYLRPPASMSAVGTAWPAATAAPPSVRLPEAGSVTILTL